MAAVVLTCIGLLILLICTCSCCSRFRKRNPKDPSVTICSKIQSMHEDAPTRTSTTV